MDTRQFRPGRALVWFSPLLLCVVASLQIYLAKTKSLSPWKGGGFGMFSTVDSPDARFLRIYLINGSEETPVLLPDNLKFLGRQAQTIPSAQLLSILAQRLAQGAWSPYRMTDPVRFYQSQTDSRNDTFTGLADPSDAALDNGENTSSHVVKVLPDGQLVFPKLLRMTERGQPAPADTVAFQSVRVELWKYSLDVASAQLQATKYLEVTADAAP